MLNVSTFLKQNPTLLQNQILVAVSGGVDSMVLLHLLLQAKCRLEVAHVNYQLRGAASEADMQMVKDFCAQNNIKSHLKKIDTTAYLAENNVGVQEGARQIRYDFFKEIVAEKDFFIATAHHANDNVETVLMHISRGTGFNGLTGIPYRNGNVIRPLLHFTKEQLVRYANENNVPYRTDASNAKNVYTRNAFRNEVIPILQKINPNFEKNMLHNIEVWKGANSIYEKHIQKTLHKLLIVKNDYVSVPINLLLKLKNIEVWLFEIFSKYHFSTAEIIEIQKLFDAENGKFFKNKEWRVYKDNNLLVITPMHNTQPGFIVIESVEDGKIKFELGDLQLHTINKPVDLQSEAYSCYVNIDALQSPLILRKAKPGDYFYPLGMPKKKKVSKFLMDIKLSQTEKERVWVLESNKKIFWIVGYRMDDRFKVRTTSEKVLQIKLFRTNG
jgi:tRNA(Ile)-lysidine synthase